MKSCTPLWREGHVEVKMSEKYHMFGALLEVAMFKSARLCGTKRISKSKFTKHHMFGPLLEVAMSKKCTPLCREAHVEVKMYKTPHVRTTKHTSSGPLLEVEIPKKCMPLWREAHFEVKMLKTPGVRTTFGRSGVVSRGKSTGLRTFSKASETRGFCRISKNDGKPGTFEEDLQRCISRGRRSTRDIFIRAVRRSGR